MPLKLHLSAKSNGSCAVVTWVHMRSGRLVLAGAQEGCRSNAGAPMCATLEAAVREGSLLWMLPSATAYAAMSSGCAAAHLSGPMLSQLAQIRYAINVSHPSSTVKHFDRRICCTQSAPPPSWFHWAARPRQCVGERCLQFWYINWSVYWASL